VHLVGFYSNLVLSYPEQCTNVQGRRVVSPAIVVFVFMFILYISKYDRCNLVATTYSFTDSLAKVLESILK
jgi:hypothetical protein